MKVGAKMATLKETFGISCGKNLPKLWVPRKLKINLNQYQNNETYYNLYLNKSFDNIILEKILLNKVVLKIIKLIKVDSYVNNIVTIIKAKFQLYNYSFLHTCYTQTKKYIVKLETELFEKLLYTVY